MFRSSCFQSVLVLFLLTSEKNYIQCICEGSAVVYCESVTDLDRVAIEMGKFWRDVTIGNKYDTPQHALTRDFFEKLHHLEKLTVINQFSKIQGFPYSDVKHVKSFIFYGNHFKRLPSVIPLTVLDTYSETRHKIEKELISFHNNDIEEILPLPTYTSRLFHPIIIKTLDLSYNKVNYIESGTFTYVQVNELFLSHNRLSLIKNPWGLPKNLTHLHLDHNEFESLSTIYLENYDLSKLVVLTISHNRLSTVEDLPDLESVCFLDLSFNRLYYIRNDLFNRYKKIRILNLQHNNLFRFTLPGQGTNIKSYSIDLRFNRLRKLDLTHDHGLTVPELSICGNPWNCRCFDNISLVINDLLQKPCVDDKGKSSLPYCAINRYYGEECTDEQISGKTLDQFRNAIRQTSTVYNAFFGGALYNTQCP